MQVKKVHISTIQVGDTVIHDGEVLTACTNNLKYDSSLGYSLFGDSYNLGYKLVTLVIKL